MRTRSRVTALLLTSVLVPAGSFADCLDPVADRLPRGGEIRLLLRDGARLDGRFHALDRPASRLGVTVYDDRDSRFINREVPLADIEALRFEETGDRGGVAVIGLLTGAAIGYWLGTSWSESVDDGGNRAETVATFTLLGAVVIGGAVAIVAPVGDEVILRCGGNRSDEFIRRRLGGN